MARLRWHVQRPNTPVQKRSKADPKKIRNQEVSSSWVHAKKDNQIDQDGSPEYSNFDKSQVRAVQSKKNPGPSRIQSKLNQPGNEIPDLLRLFPNPSRRNADTKIKKCPNRPKNPIGRIEAWLAKRFIPFARREERAHSGCAKSNTNQDKVRKPYTHLLNNSSTPHHDKSKREPVTLNSIARSSNRDLSPKMEHIKFI